MLGAKAKMKLTIKRQNFLKMLNYAIQAIPAKSAESQFLNFLIIVGSEDVSVIASDGTLSCKVVQPSKDEKATTSSSTRKKA